MRYVSTLNPKRELDFDQVKSGLFSPDGGSVLPQSIPILLNYQLKELTDMPFWGCFCHVLGRFFPVGNLERAIDIQSPRCTHLRDHVTLFELWDARTGKLEGILYAVLEKVGCRNVCPGSWAFTAAHIALLFSFYGEAVKEGKLTFGEPMVLAAEDASFDFSAAAWFARKMGLPVATVILTSNEEDATDETYWDLLHRGQFLRETPNALYVTLCDLLGEGCLETLEAAYGGKMRWNLPEDCRKTLRQLYYPAVISTEARCDMIRQLFRTEHILVSPPTAAAFLAAGQYRAVTADRSSVFLLASESPVYWGETVLHSMGIPKKSVLIQIETLEQAAKAEREGM